MSKKRKVKHMLSFDWPVKDALGVKLLSDTPVTLCELKSLEDKRYSKQNMSSESRAKGYKKY